MKVSFKGADGLSKELDKIAREIKRKAEKISGDVPIADLFTESFMAEYTDQKTSDDFFSMCHIQSTEDLEAFPESELDKIVKDHTKFSSWKEMLNKAGELYVARRWKDL